MKQDLTWIIFFSSIPKQRLGNASIFSKFSDHCPIVIELKEWLSKLVSFSNRISKVSRETIKIKSEEIAVHEEYKNLFEDWPETGKIEVDGVAEDFVKVLKKVSKELSKEQGSSGVQKGFKRRRGSRKFRRS